MRVSVIVLTCNQCDVTLRCLEALSPFMLRHEDAELVLVDNGSSDGTQEMVENCVFPWKSRLGYYVSEKNLGVAAGRNIGLRKAVGGTLILLDNDTLPAADVLDALLEKVENNQDVGVAAPALCSPDGIVQCSAKPFPGLIEKVRNVLSIGRTDNLLQPCYVIGACQAFRRDVADAAGPLDEKIFYGPEDADFCIRVRNAGYRIVYCPELTLIHDYRRATTRRLWSRLARRHFSALMYFWWKYKRL